jgi:hypothetical protein
VVHQRRVAWAAALPIQRVGQRFFQQMHDGVHNVLTKQTKEYVMEHVARTTQEDIKINAEQPSKPIVNEFHPPLPLPVIYTPTHAPKYVTIVAQNFISQRRHRPHDRAKTPQRPTAAGDIQLLRGALAHVASASTQGNMHLNLLIVAADKGQPGDAVVNKVVPRPHLNRSPAEFENGIRQNPAAVMMEL